jgi:hypothetical protein
MRFVFGFLLVCGIFGRTAAQSTAYVFQAGPTIGFQRWDNTFERDPLFQYHAALAIETVNNEDDRDALFMQIGYHVKGSANRFRFFYQGGGIDSYSEQFKFNNLSLILGFKRHIPQNEATRYFYFGGLRGDYTLSTNIDDLASSNPYAPLYYPFIGSMNRWMFGLSLGGGLEFKLGELVGGQLKLSLHPDLTLQYNQPSLENVLNPYSPGTTTTIPERRIRNNALELSVGIRLLRKVVYVDE